MRAKWHPARNLIAHFTKEEFRVFVPPPVPPSKGRGGKSSTKEDSENDENEADNESSGSVGSASSAGSRTRPQTKSMAPALLVTLEIRLVPQKALV